MTEYPRFTAMDEFEADMQFRYYHVLGANDIFNPHCHEFFEIFITVSGTVIHWLNGVTQALPEGSLVFIRPDDIHGYLYETPRSADTVYVNLSFRKELLHDLFRYFSDTFPSKALLSSDMPPMVILSKTEKDRLVAQINELNTVNRQDKQALNLRIRIVLAEIFARGFSQLPAVSATDAPVWLTQLMSEMELPENFTAGSERMVALSRRTQEHLSRCIKRHYGMTVTEYINDLRINYASNLLLNTNTPVIEIGYSCGFQSLSNFYKAFGKVHGQSPTSFRRTYK